MAIADRKVLYGINSEILTEELFSAQTIAKSTNASSSAIDLNLAGGQFSLQIELTGDGTAQIEWLGSNNGDDYIKPNNASDIVTAFTKTGGPGGDGKAIYGFNVSLVEKLKIKVTETGGSDSITVTATLAIQ
jgi:hypothetical protein